MDWLLDYVPMIARFSVFLAYACFAIALFWTRDQLKLTLFGLIFWLLSVVIPNVSIGTDVVFALLTTICAIACVIMGFRLFRGDGQREKVQLVEAGYDDDWVGSVVSVDEMPIDVKGMK